MANAEHLEILKSGVEKWNEWRKNNEGTRPDLSGANLSLSDLHGANLIRANLSRINLNGANLADANLSRSHMRDAKLRDANLLYANLSGVDLSYANLSRADLTGAELSNANLYGANLFGAILISADFSGAILANARIYGISVWDIKKEGAIQKDLVITKKDEPVITVDNLEVAQFIYLILNNQNIRDVIDTITSKAVLILGRFTEERKAVLDAIKDELRKRNYLPILFDFEGPDSRDVTETVSILARMSRFVIADITDAKSILQELTLIVPHNPSLPVLPIILEDQSEPGMFSFFKRFPWFMPLHSYASPETMLSQIVKVVIEPAEKKVINASCDPNEGLCQIKRPLLL